MAEYSINALDGIINKLIVYAEKDNDPDGDTGAMTLAFVILGTRHNLPNRYFQIHDFAEDFTQTVITFDDDSWDDVGATGDLSVFVDAVQQDAPDDPYKLTADQITLLKEANDLALTMYDIQDDDIGAYISTHSEGEYIQTSDDYDDDYEEDNLLIDWRIS